MTTDLSAKPSRLVACSALSSDLLSLAAFLVLPLVLLMPLVAFPEVDAFYHLRHASLYVERGALMQEFPWHTQSVIGSLGADIWYGFHLLLVPFAQIGDPMLAVKLASAALLSAFLIAVYALCRKVQAPFPWLWPLVLLGATPIEAWRWQAMRPFLLSLALAAWVLIAACAGSPIAWRVGVLAFCIAWLHSAFFWLGPLVALAAFLSRGLFERVWRPWIPCLALLGSGAGLLARPDAFDGLRILKVQLVDLGVALRSDPFLEFGTELNSILRFGASGEFGLFAAFWLAVVVASFAVARRRGGSLAEYRKSAFGASFGLAALFAAMAWFLTMRAVEPWVLFATLSMALAMGAALNLASGRRPARGATLAKALAASVLVWGLLGSLRSVAASRQAIDAAGRNVFRLEEAMRWLKANSEEGDVVFHTGWSLFPEMFFWNTHNRYITGMDPIFLYAHDRGLFYKFTGIEVDVTTDRVTGSRPGPDAVWEDTYAVLRQQFLARYVLAVHETNPKFVRYLRSDPRYREVYSGVAASVFELR